MTGPSTPRVGAGPRRVLINRLGGPRFASALLLDALGSGVVMPLSVLFFTLHKGMPATTTGLGITIGGAVSMVLAPFGGHLIDALTPKRALLLSWLLAALASAAWVLVHNLLELAVVQALTNFTTGVGWNAGAAQLAALSEDRDVSQVMATSYALKNLGFGAGALLSVLALAVGGVGFDIAVYANAASFVLGAALALGVRQPPARAPSPDEVPDATTIWTVLSDWRYVGLAFFNSLMAFNQVALQVALPLWVVLDTHAPREMVGLMYALNTVMIVSLQLRVSAAVGELADTPRMYLRGALTMVAAGGLYLASHYAGVAGAVVLLLAGTVMLTFTEMCVSASAFVVSIKLAHPEHRGKYLSVFGMGWALEGTTGPIVGTALVAAGVLCPWPVIAAIVAVGAFASRVIVRRAREPGGLPVSGA